MKPILTPVFYLLTLLIGSTFLTSCQVVGDIFGAGFYTGVFLVVIIVAVIIYFVARIGKNK
ncbi:MAG: hypothetical protein HOP08_14025 [Cyclobacteriaceae bacterium]|nr:hypothetical protein [Cyclobacteriaceae bacterium]